MVAAPIMESLPDFDAGTIFYTLPDRTCGRNELTGNRRYGSPLIDFNLLDEADLAKLSGFALLTEHNMNDIFVHVLFSDSLHPATAS